MKAAEVDKHASLLPLSNALMWQNTLGYYNVVSITAFKVDSDKRSNLLHGGEKHTSLLPFGFDSLIKFFIVNRDKHTSLLATNMVFRTKLVNTVKRLDSARWQTR